MTRRWFGSLGLLAAAGLAGCASDWQERYEQSQRDMLDMSSKQEELRASNAQTVAQYEAQRAQMSAMEREQARLQEERDAAARRAAEWQAEAEKSAQSRSSTDPAVGIGMSDTAAAEKMVKDLRDAGYPDARVTPDGNIEVPLDSDVTFASGKSDLTDGGKRSLKGLGGQIATGRFAPYLVRIEGHTDSDPIKRQKDKYNDNRDLGAARANEVVRFMEREMGISPERLMSASMGEHKPVADNKSPQGRSKNRRIEVIVVIPRDAYVAQAR